MELEPPSTFPRGQWIPAPVGAFLGLGAVVPIEHPVAQQRPSARRDVDSSGGVSGGPASSKTTRLAGFSLKRAATAHPAEARANDHEIRFHRPIVHDLIAPMVAISALDNRTSMTPGGRVCVEIRVFSACKIW